MGFGGARDLDLWQRSAPNPMLKDPADRDPKGRAWGLEPRGSHLLFWAILCHNILGIPNAEFDYIGTLDPRIRKVLRVIGFRVYTV